MAKEHISDNSIWKEILVAIVTVFVTVLVTKTCDRIYPEDNRVIISDTLRVVETHTSRCYNDSLLYVAIAELTRTIRETTPRNNNIKIVLPGPGNISSSEDFSDKNSAHNNDLSNSVEDQNFVNKIVDKKAFYKKGYTIKDGAALYVFEKIPKVEDKFLTFEIRLVQPVDLLSHIYLTICNTNEKGELYQYFDQTYEVRDGLNRIQIANNLHEGKNRIDIGVFIKTDEGKDFPAFYRNVITLVK